MTGKPPRMPGKPPQTTGRRAAPMPARRTAPMPARRAAPMPDAEAPPMAEDPRAKKKRRTQRQAPKGARRVDAEDNARAKTVNRAPKAAPDAKSPTIAFNAPTDPAVIAAVAQLRAAGTPERATPMPAYHKTGRLCFGVANTDIDALAKDWRATMAEGPDPQAARLSLAAGLWNTGGFETRIAAAKLLTQARIAGDAPVWDLIASWVPQFDGWAIADAVASAGSRRLTADPARLDDVDAWTGSEHMWTRRAALVFTLPFAKGRPNDTVQAARERVLGWAAGYAEDRDWFIQKSVGAWLRSLSVHDADRVRAFMDAHGAAMKPFARKEALRLIA
jgi:3-methyladenine DNA glycosylase AlkD